MAIGAGTVRQGRTGLTLIELAVTITIIGIVVSVAVPAMRDLTVGDDAGPLEPLRALLVRSRRDAAVNGSPAEVWVVPTSGRYRVAMRGANGLDVQEGVLPLRDVRARGPSDRFRVVFNPVGFGVGDTLAAAGVVVRVDAATGEVAVER